MRVKKLTSVLIRGGRGCGDYCKTRINNVPLILTSLTFAINSLKF